MCGSAWHTPGGLARQSRAALRLPKLQLEILCCHSAIESTHSTKEGVTLPPFGSLLIIGGMAACYTRNDAETYDIQGPAIHSFLRVAVSA